MRSSSREFPVVLAVAQAAKKFCTTQINEQEVVLAGFANTGVDAAKAITVIEKSKGWKGTPVFAGGKVVAPGKPILDLLPCFATASACRDRKAHCSVVIQDPSVPESGVVNSFRFENTLYIDRAVYEFPCKLLFQHFSPVPGHPSRATDQTQAAGARFGADICPHFDPGPGGPSGTVEETIDLRPAWRDVCAALERMAANED